MDYKTIIFDFDGTIADTFALVVGIANSMSKMFGFQPLTLEEISWMRHKRAQDLLSVVKIPFYNIPKFLYSVKSQLNKEVDAVQPISGIAEVLEKLHNNNKVLGIVTSNDRDTVDKFLKNHSLYYFDFIYSEKDLFGKGRVLNKLINKKELNRDGVIYVGDETRDIEAARKAKIPVISVSWGFNAYEALEKAKPDYLINNPEQLVEITCNRVVLQ